MSEISSDSVFIDDEGNEVYAGSGTVQWPDESTVKGDSLTGKLVFIRSIPVTKGDQTTNVPMLVFLKDGVLHGVWAGAQAQQAMTENFFILNRTYTIVFAGTAPSKHGVDMNNFNFKRHPVKES